MTGTLTKAKKNKVNAMKNAGPRPPKDTDKVNLSLDAHGMFGKVGISAPLIVGEVSKVVELLKEKKEEFLPYVPISFPSISSIFSCGT